MGVRAAVQERKRFLREGLAILLGEDPDIEVIGTAATAAELLHLCGEHPPDVVLMELDLDDWDPAALAATLRANHPAIRIVGVGDGCDDVDAHVTRTDGPVTIVSALLSLTRRESSGGGSSPAVSAVTAAADRGLTARQIEILQHLRAGLTANEISASLGISPKTVEHHKRRVFARLGARSQAQAVAMGLRTGILLPDPAWDAWWSV